MNVTVRYYAQLRHATGSEVEALDLPAGATVAAAIAVAVERHGAALKPVLCDDAGGVRPTIIMLVKGAPVTASHQLVDGDELTLLSPVAGG